MDRRYVSMARRTRLVFPGVALHVIQRGVDRTTCFRAEADYLVYLSQLHILAAKHGCAIHAYCLMTNHVHLLLTPSEETSCTSLMRDLGQRYVPYFNSRHWRTGTLWEGRFRSCVAESQHYVLACYRYIELNPVRARMVNDPVSYPWSSYAVNSGARLDPRLVPHAEFAALGREGNARNRAYQGLFERQLDEPLLAAIRDATNAGYPLVSDTFKTRVLEPLGCKTAPAKPGPRSIFGPGPELGQRVLALTPN
ncbi:MAG TPA: transposase [Burkholderiales bacterium]|nr:transposase [Burkholderiales bacterium]